MKKIPNDELLRMLKADTQAPENRTAIEFLYYKLSNKVKAFVISHKGTKEDGEEVFIDGLLVVDEYAKGQKFKLGTNIQAFLFQVCKYTWYKKYNSRKNPPIISLDDNVINDLDKKTTEYIDAFMGDEEDSKLLKIIKELGGDCQKLLIWIYYDNIHPEELVLRFNLGSMAAFKNKKSKCMKKLRDLFD